MVWIGTRLLLAWVYVTQCLATDGEPVPFESLLQFQAHTAQSHLRREESATSPPCNVDRDTFSLLVGETDATGFLESQLAPWSVLVNISTTPMIRGGQRHGDTAVLWKNDNTGMCFAAFGATNDPMDINNIVGGFTLPPADFCGMGVNAGILSEFYAFASHDATAWADFVAKTQNTEYCPQGTAVGGTSLGAALASMFVAGANRGCPAAGFSESVDFCLLTAGTLAAFTTEVTKEDGTRFEGVRYGITDAECSQTELLGMTQADRVDFKIKSLELVRSTIPLMVAVLGNPAFNLLDGPLTQAIGNMTAMKANGSYTMAELVFAGTDAVLMQYHVMPAFMAAGANRHLVPVQMMYPMLVNLAAVYQQEYLQDPTDPVLTFGHMFGFQVVKQDFQAVKNQLYSYPEHDDACFQNSDLSPVANKWQTLWRIAAGQISASGFFDHPICCYHTDYQACGNMFQHAPAFGVESPFCIGGAQPAQMEGLIAMLGR